MNKMFEMNRLKTAAIKAKEEDMRQKQSNKIEDDDDDECPLMKAHKRTQWLEHQQLQFPDLLCSKNQSHNNIEESDNDSDNMVGTHYDDFEW